MRKLSEKQLLIIFLFIGLETKVEVNTPTETSTTKVEVNTPTETSTTTLIDTGSWSFLGCGRFYVIVFFQRSCLVIYYLHHHMIWNEHYQKRGTPYYLYP